MNNMFKRFKINVFPNISSLEPLYRHFGPQIRILHVEILPRDTSGGLETDFLRYSLNFPGFLKDFGL